MHRRRQRQAARDLGQRGQVELVAGQLAPGGPAVAAAVAQLHIAARPGQAVRIDEMQVARADFGAAARVAPAQPAGERREGQRLQLRAEAGRHRAQRHVGGGGRQGALPGVEPQAHRPMPVLHIDAPVGLHVGVRAQARHVDALEIGVTMAVPFAPEPGMARKHPLAELADQREAIAPVGGGRGVQPKLMAAITIAHHQLHVGQLHRRCGAPLVHPAHTAAAHQELRLREKPVSGLAVAIGIAGQVDAAHQQAPVGGAPQLQRRLVDDQLFQPALRQRQHRERHQHARHVQAGAAGRVVHAHIAQGHRRHQAVGLGRDGVDGHGRGHGARGQVLQPGAKLVDSRHNAPMEDGRGQRQPAKQHGDTAQHPSHDDGGKLEGRLNQRLTGKCGVLTRA